MSSDDIDPHIRAELIRLCGNSKRRTHQSSPSHPARWQPGTVLDPRAEDKYCFSTNTAWSYIVERLEAGEVVTTMKLDIPSGKTGYVMKIAQPNLQILYVKLQLAGVGVHGRSFHYSDYY